MIRLSNYMRVRGVVTLPEMPDIPPGFVAALDQDRQACKEVINRYIIDCEPYPIVDNALLWGAVVKQMGRILEDPDGLTWLVGIAATLMTEKIEASRA